ncbi:alpha/beta fold hydrolase [Aquiflexum sp.]|uniref:alpha/beta fold hydrolase n=1 Tax=Aquiflexum sp. TaxID=1872584 RepID=UPI003593E6EF
MRFLLTSSGNLAYRKFGNGRNIHLLFHGFGQNIKAFDSFLVLRKEEDTYLVFDIFFHGQSTWKSNSEKLTKEIWEEFIALLMRKENIETFHLIGYSMGGKFCLVTYELFPTLVNSLTLMAPDGIKTGFWYNMATFPGILNRSFRHVIFHPNRFFKTVDILHRLGLLQASLVKFVKSQMQTRTKRAQIYFTWNIFKPMQPDLKQIIYLLNELKTPITLFTGEFDQMVTSENLEEFTSQIPHIEKIELSCGHNTLISDTADYIALKENR